MTINWYILLAVCFYELLLWAAWVKEDGYFELPAFAPFGLWGAVQYTYYRLWSVSNMKKNTPRESINGA